MAKKKALKLVAGNWWALVRGPKCLPVIFATRQQARENREADEYMVRVKVTPTEAERTQP